MFGQGRPGAAAAAWTVQQRTEATEAATHGVTTRLDFSDLWRAPEAATRWSKGSEISWTRSGTVVKKVEATTPRRMADVHNEIGALESFYGRNIVKLLGVKTEGLSASGIPLPGQKPVFHIETEGARGNLRDQVLSRMSGDVREDVKLLILIDVLHALRKLERKGWVHRNIKPENILIFGDPASESGCVAKLGDFAYACELHNDHCQDLDVVRMVGSPLYTAPEVWSASHISARKMDVWSLGMVAFELFTGAPPRQLFDLNLEPGFVTEVSRIHPFSHSISADFKLRDDPAFQALRSKDKEVAKLVRRMLTKRVWRRPTAGRLLRIAERIAKARGITSAEP